MISEKRPATWSTLSIHCPLCDGDIPVRVNIAGGSDDSIVGGARRLWILFGRHLERDHA